MVNIKEIERVYKLFEDADIGEIEIKNEKGRIKISIGDKNIQNNKFDNKKVIEVNPVKATVDNAPLINIAELKSDWVGFFTRLNPKTGEYYLKLRDEVKKDQVICHVRVLGVLQDVKSPIDGKLKEILIEEGQPIEFGQPIMRFEV